MGQERNQWDLCRFRILRLGRKLKAALQESKETQVFMLGFGDIQSTTKAKCSKGLVINAPQL